MTGAGPGDDLREKVAQAIRNSNGTPEAMDWWRRYPHLIPAEVYADAAIEAVRADQPDTVAVPREVAEFLALDLELQHRLPDMVKHLRALLSGESQVAANDDLHGLNHGPASVFREPSADQPSDG